METVANECLMYLRSAKKYALDTSLGEPIETDKNGNELTLSDIIAADDTIAPELEERMRREQLIKALDTLDERSKEIIILRYGLRDGVELTQKETAERLGISRSYVSRIEKKAIGSLHDRMSRWQ